MGNATAKHCPDYLCDLQSGALSTIDENDQSGIGVTVVSAETDSPSPLLKITFRTSKAEWSVIRTPVQVGKMHFALHVKLFSEMVDMRAHNGKPEVDWYLFLVKHRREVSDRECEQFQQYLLWLLSKPKMRSSDHFGEFAEVSALSFVGPDKPLLEGYAMKRRGGRRFMQGGASGAIAGVQSMFRKRFSKRWFALKPDGVVYIENRRSEKILDVILFDSAFEVCLVAPSEGKRGTITPSCFRSSSAEDSHFLQIHNGYRKIILRFDNHSRAVEWMHALKSAHAISEWNQHHRFGSFAPPRVACTVKYLIDGEPFMNELLVALRGAQKEIYISGWWLVPDLPLSRPGIENTILGILGAIAARGVKIFIVLYKELSMALTLDSMHTKQQLEALSDNIRVILHPRQLGVRAVLAWSHHQKLIVVDHEIAFVGGLDLCLGRFDNASHRLYDGSHPHMFPGCDYCNPCLRDFVDVRDPMSNDDIADRSREPRLPWHDVHCMLQGPVVSDIVRHFVQLWNHVRTDKHKRSHRMNMLEVKRTQAKPVSAMSKIKRKVEEWTRKKPKPADKSDSESESSSSEADEADLRPLSADAIDEMTDSAALILGRSVTIHGDVPLTTIKRRNTLFKTPYRSKTQLSFEGILRTESLSSSVDERFTSSVQFLRSGSRWSLGLLTECSIMNAYMQLISAAKSFVYIENQFFVTTCSRESDYVKNLIGRAIADRILKAEADGECFKVYVVMPVMPAFENSKLFNPGGFVTRLTLELQFQALVRGPDSILGYMSSVVGTERAAEVFHSHLTLCGLRQIDAWPDGTVLTEQLYVHSKVMIVDDEHAIIGSANVNDRSMLGDRDSEIAVLVEDANFAQSLRTDLWKEHFGLTHTNSALNLRSDRPEVQESITEAFNQPSSDACFQLWRETAINNAVIFRDLFGVVPCNDVKTRAEFESRMHSNVNRPRVKVDSAAGGRLKQVVGRVVEFPLRFLESETSLQDPMPATASLCPKEVFS